MPQSAQRPSTNSEGIKNSSSAAAHTAGAVSYTHLDVYKRQVLTAKEKLCPAPTRCRPDFCPRARGHYLRQGEAVAALLTCRDAVWTLSLIHI